MKRFILVSLVLLGACSEGAPDRYRAGTLEGCKLRWKDSGYEYRLSEPYRAYANTNTLGYYCQVRVEGRWVNEDNVKIGG